MIASTLIGTAGLEPAHGEPHRAADEPVGGVHVEVAPERRPRRPPHSIVSNQVRRICSDRSRSSAVAGRWSSSRSSLWAISHACAMAQHRAERGVDERVEAGRGRVDAGERRRRRGGIVVEVGEQDLGDDVVLAPEVLVEAARLHPDGVADLADRGGGEPLRGEQTRRLGEDLLRRRPSPFELLQNRPESGRICQQFAKRPLMRNLQARCDLRVASSAARPAASMRGVSGGSVAGTSSIATTRVDTTGRRSLRGQNQRNVS